MIALPEVASIAAWVERLGGVLDESVDPALVLETIGASDRDGAPSIAPVLNDRGVAERATEARLLLVDRRVADRVVSGRRWVHPNATLALARLLEAAPPTALSSRHAIDSSAKIGANVEIEPGARIGADVVVGAGSFVGSGAVIYPRTTIGARVVIGAGAIVGREGFGFADDRGDDRIVRAVRIRHLAGVAIGDDVALGALCTVDAGLLTTTTIGAETKIDAHVHVGHGVLIGRRCRVAAQCGFAGSARVGDDVWIGGQVGIGDHVRVGDRARIAGKSGVIGDIDADAIVAGYPAVARARWLRGHARLYRK